MFNPNSIIEKAFEFRFSHQNVFFFVDCSENDVIYDWLFKNIKEEWSYYKIIDGALISSNDFQSNKSIEMVINPIIIITIKDEKDAALFKLTWT